MSAKIDGTSSTPRVSGSASESGPATVGAAAMVGRLDFPMFVVTAMVEPEAKANGRAGGPSGCLAGFVTQCSIVPARFFVCISKENHTFAVAERVGALGLHLLGRDQLELARVFGELTGDDADKFALVDWHPGASGVPLLDRCAAWLEGAVVARFDAGDHVGHLIEPAAGGGGGETGELWYSAVRDLKAGHPPTGGRR